MGHICIKYENKLIPWPKPINPEVYIHNEGKWNQITFYQASKIIDLRQDIFTARVDVIKSWAEGLLTWVSGTQSNISIYF